MATKQEIEEFVKFELGKLPEPRNLFEECDSLDRVDMIIRCENNYNIPIDEGSISSDYTTDDFVTLIIKKLIEYERAAI